MRTPRLTAPARPAFTLIELAAAIAASGALLATASMFLGTGQPDEASARAQSIQLKDATQIRGIGQAFVIFAQNNRDSYPLPSQFDLQDMTVAARGTEKDTSANLMSMLVFSGFIPTDLLVSPAESSASIRMYETYEFVNPARAAVPPQALWDPGFTADFTDGQTGHLSYAHQIPASERRARWSTTFNAAEPILGNRGPEVAAIREAGQSQPRDVVPVYATRKSMTFRIHGAPDTWEGNIAYNDNHVNFETSAAPAEVRYTMLTFNPADANNPWARAQARDVLFFDEPDAEKRENAFLGIFTHAGPATKHFRAIWN